MNEEYEDEECEDEEGDIEWSFAKDKFVPRRSQRAKAADSDALFCAALNAAIAAGLEACPTAVSTAPGTRSPVYISPERAALFSEQLSS